MTIRRIKHHPADRSTGSVSTDPLKHEKGSGRAGLAVVAVLLSGPIALITIPAFWLFGYTLLQSVLLTALVQLAIFLVMIVYMLYQSPRDTETCVSTPKTSDITILEQGIWHSYGNGKGDGRAFCIALIAQPSVQSRQIATDLAAQGYDIHHTTNMDAMFETILMRPDASCFLIFDLDLLDGLEADLDDLMSFRQNCSTIPILLLSGSVIRDDLSEHCRAIGDATLRKPVFRNNLLSGITAMRKNWEVREVSEY